ncbi:transmembrane anchor protein [Methylobacterium goesingense]|uniref:Transmembrane anchor protein n=2 Tax=Methylobacterium goesingense TaxID=243690 RepID=A0ABV2LF18_9HYPH
MLGLTEMGEIKTQVAAEAEADRQRDAAPASQPAGPSPRSDLMNRVLALFVIGGAQAQTAAVPQEKSVTLKPGEGSEIKMAMKAGAKANYSWSASGSSVNYDMHGTAPGGKESSYKRGRDATGDTGVLTAGYEGHHGWFWRNRGQAPVTVTVKVTGDFDDLKIMK